MQGHSNLANGHVHVHQMLLCGLAAIRALPKYLSIWALPGVACVVAMRQCVNELCSQVSDSSLQWAMALQKPSLKDRFFRGGGDQPKLCL
jgi:hypothetical protein